MTAGPTSIANRLRALPRAVNGIWVIGLCGLLFRWWAVLVYRPTCKTDLPDCYTLAGDAFYTHVQADLIADGHWFKNGAEFIGSGTIIDSAGDPPLYSLFLASFSKLGMDSVTWHRGASTLFGLALIVLAGLFARRLAGDRAGLIAALFAAAHPLMWINDMMLLSEGMYQPMIVIVMWTAYEWTRDPTRRRMVWLGVAIAFAALTRAEALALLGFLVVPLVIWRNPLGRNERIRQGSAAMIAALVVMSPWVIYNNLRFENPVGLSAVSGTVIMAGSCDTAWSGESMGIWARCFEERNLQVEMEEELPGSWRTVGDPGRVIYDESVRDRFMTEKALEYTLDNIGRYPLVVMARMGRSLEVFRVGHTLRVNYLIEGRWRVPSTLGLITYYALIPFTALGLVVLRRDGQRLVPFLAMWTTVMFASAITFGLTRYRVPIDVAMLVLSAVGVAWLWPRFRARFMGYAEVDADDPVLEEA